MTYNDRGRLAADAICKNISLLVATTNSAPSTSGVERKTSADAPVAILNTSAATETMSTLSVRATSQIASAFASVGAGAASASTKCQVTASAST
ncbi:hypothetical protein VNO77_24553 [Canavalia gladiata]|uniref:Uncharacterized protein n=1 Tax=Canavalia gladiata TaxID=3824 RepID=A0AAN9L780_CANGL